MLTGMITSAIQGRQSEVDSLGEQIADWDVRLAQRKQTLQTQFTNMEVALGQLKDQSNWLAGQLASLSEGRRLYLVIKNLSAAAPPETLYRVYLDLPEGTPDDPLNSHYVGSFNFFDAVPHGEEHGTNASKPVSFDITDVAANVQARNLLKAEHSVSIVPSSQPVSDAKPAIGDISFVVQ